MNAEPANRNAEGVNGNARPFVNARNTLPNNNAPNAPKNGNNGNAPKNGNNGNGNTPKNGNNGNGNTPNNGNKGNNNKKVNNNTPKNGNNNKKVNNNTPKKVNNNKKGNNNKGIKNLEPTDDEMAIFTKMGALDTLVGSNDTLMDKFVGNGWTNQNLNKNYEPSMRTNAVVLANSYDAPSTPQTFEGSVRPTFSKHDQTEAGQGGGSGGSGGSCCGSRAQSEGGETGNEK